MARWPRTITRGHLKGETYATEHAYRHALRTRLSAPTRAEQRNILARKLGFHSYAERRKAKETVGEKQYLLIKRKHGDRVGQIVARENRLFDTSSTPQRVNRVGKDLQKYGERTLGRNAGYVWQELYRGREA